MGVDLKLLPFYDSQVEFSHCILQLERRRELWPIIEKIEREQGMPVSKNFTSFCGKDSKGNTCYGKTTTTPYGIKINWVYSKYLKTLSQQKEVKNNYPNKAVWAYLLSCPNDLKIALYWH